MTIYETPRYIIRGLQGLDELIAEDIYQMPEGSWDTYATSNTGFQHELPGAPFSFRSFNWSDCIHEDKEPEGGNGVPWGFCRDETCESCKPQFHHFESGLKLWWYKHASRIPEANREVSKKEWREIQREIEDWALEQPTKEPW